MEGDTELEDPEESEETAVEEEEEPVERLVTRSVELERMGYLRESWARKVPSTV